MTRLRPAQEKILEYTGGRMAISAVPGSGKTYTLALLAAQLIADGRISPATDQQVLVVTYLNSSVDTFVASIRQRLDEIGLPASGFVVRTLHSLALEIVRLSSGGLGTESSEPMVQDETQSDVTLALAVDSYIESHPDIWHAFLPEDSVRMRTRWRKITQDISRSFIRTAKNGRHRPADLIERLRSAGQSDDHEGDDIDSQIARSPLLWMMADIYERYQNILVRLTLYDFDDLIWQATDLLEGRPDLAGQLRLRWPYVLEDEAQDSVPLQEVLIQTLVGDKGNWVRVGDPNQAITSTFTAAHPQFFIRFLEQPGVASRPLPNSGRSAPLIFGAANALLGWVMDHHPVPEVRKHAFRRQEILPTPAGDAQPNPADNEASIRIRVYKHREDEELPAVARLAAQYADEQNEHTLAILVPTNQIGHDLSLHLDKLGADYDNMLRGGSQEREIAAAMHAVLALLADPLDTRALVNAHASLNELGHPDARGTGDSFRHLQTLLRSTHQPESLLFPWSTEAMVAALPAGVTSEEDLAHITRFAEFIRRIFLLRPLPISDLALALGDELFAQGEVDESNLATAYQLAAVMRRWHDTHPEWRLPDLVAQLEEVAEGRQDLNLSPRSDIGYEPQPGRITLATQHGAKGLEWDAVFLAGMDGFWIPGDLDAPFLGVHQFLGGDPSAEVLAQLRYLMDGDAGLFPGRDPTESLHIEVICERLRLLYVGITRARRYLHVSRSRATKQYDRDREAQPASVVGVLYEYLKRVQS